MSCFVKIWTLFTIRINLSASYRRRRFSVLMYVCPCIIYENDERYPLDVTILFIIINNSTCFGHLYAHLQEYIGCIRIILLHIWRSPRLRLKLTSAHFGILVKIFKPSRTRALSILQVVTSVVIH